MAIAPTSHWNFLTTLAFLECFYMVLINKEQVLKESEDLFFTLTTYGYNFKMAGSFLPFDFKEI